MYVDEASRQLGPWVVGGGGGTDTSVKCKAFCQPPSTTIDQPHPAAAFLNGALLHLIGKPLCPHFGPLIENEFISGRLSRISKTLSLSLSLFLTKINP